MYTALRERLVRVRELFYSLRKQFAPLREALSGLRERPCVGASPNQRALVINGDYRREHS